MKKVWIIILGIIDILAGAVINGFYMSGFLEPPILSDLIFILLPGILAWITSLICGIITLKRKNWRWGVGGLGAIVLAVLYFWLLLEGMHA